MYVTVLAISFRLHISLIHKVLVDLIDETWQEIHGLLGIKNESHGINLSQGQ